MPGTPLAARILESIKRWVSSAVDTEVSHTSDESALRSVDRIGAPKATVHRAVAEPAHVTLEFRRSSPALERLQLLTAHARQSYPLAAE